MSNEIVSNLNLFFMMNYSPELLDSDDKLYARDIADMTPLMVKCFDNDLNGVKVLLNEGVDIDEVDMSGQTALMLAAKYSSIEIIKELLYRGASKDMKDVNGKKFTNYLAAYKRKKIYEYMTEIAYIKSAMK